MTAPGDRPQPKDERIIIPVNPCVACWRVSHLLVPAEWVAENAIRKIVLCLKHYNEFREMDQDYRGGTQSKGMVLTTYRRIAPGEHIVIEGGKDL